MSRFSSGLKRPLKKAAGKPTAPIDDEFLNPPQPPSRVGKVAISAYFDPAVRKQLAIMAIEKDKSQAALIADALNMLFSHHGKPPIAHA